MAAEHAHRISKHPGRPAHRERTPVEHNIAKAHVLQRLRQVSV